MGCTAISVDWSYKIDCRNRMVVGIKDILGTYRTKITCYLNNMSYLVIAYFFVVVFKPCVL
jgi:hypothetical protein